MHKTGCTQRGAVIISSPGYCRVLFPLSTALNAFYAQSAHKSPRAILFSQKSGSVITHSAQTCRLQLFGHWGHPLFQDCHTGYQSCILYVNRKKVQHSAFLSSYWPYTVKIGFFANIGGFVMTMTHRVLICLGILLVDLGIFFLPLTALFLIYIILYNPPWFREFLNTLDSEPDQEK